MTDVIDRDGANATASFLLNDDHDVVGEPDKEGVIDNCAVCLFAVGWVQPTSLGPDEYGHATVSSSDEVRAWIAAKPLPELAPTFESPWSDGEEHAGKTFVLVKVIDASNYDPTQYDEEVLPKYKVRFEDGTEIDAGPEEVLAGWPGWDQHSNHPSKRPEASNG